MVRYKVRYVAKGYAQKYGVDFDKTTTPTAHLQSIRMLLHITASLGWDIQQYDIKTAFLNGILPPDETMYMEQPAGFEVDGKEDWVWKLLKSIYGMRQASRIWNKTFHEAVLGWCFTQLPSDWCIYIVMIVRPRLLFFSSSPFSLALRTVRLLSYLLHALPSPLLNYIRVHQYPLMCTLCAPFMPVFPHRYLMYHCTFCARFPTP